MNILILCTGNSCRSQMAHRILKALDQELAVYSAGTNPAKEVHPKAIQVMKELGLDISSHQPHHIDQYLDKTWDFVITVCGGAKETCPAFIGNVKTRLHIGFEDPANAKGSDEEVIKVFRLVRDQILRDFFTFYHKEIKKS